MILSHNASDLPIDILCLYFTILEDYQMRPVTRSRKPTRRTATKRLAPVTRSADAYDTEGPFRGLSEEEEQRARDRLEEEREWTNADYVNFAADDERRAEDEQRAEDERLAIVQTMRDRLGAQRAVLKGLPRGAQEELLLVLYHAINAIAFHARLPKILRSLRDRTPAQARKFITLLEASIRATSALSAYTKQLVSPRNPEFNFVLKKRLDQDARRHMKVAHDALRAVVAPSGRVPTVAKFPNPLIGATRQIDDLFRSWGVRPMEARKHTQALSAFLGVAVSSSAIGMRLTRSGPRVK
jgi:hypothetical protein